ncbi:DUF7009 family protein [Mucilaginibacter gotjawali]|uniref:Uncharacterized protein n=2 Tax=Mucilaginibacter gotjawali TaxID=1550579 RepID=A0A839SM85_9SPHI|nr:hypothetical protein [Mucilaginibacter gotjawali]MBB3058488.1 hypothetical protein [Mucilaginibacter gotjawali]BAU55712.1 hypothetical protein MgSA37_03904 [Mucilaginibacter gotjawali]
MKIRIKGNSLRYRLTKTDVARFLADGYLEEAIDFGMQMLTYAIQQNHLNNLSALFENNKITLFMPEIMANEWLQSDRVGFDYCENGLHLLIEKDFKCLDNVAEDQSDNYPNPLVKIQW